MFALLLALWARIEDVHLFYLQLFVLVEPPKTRAGQDLQQERVELLPGHLAFLPVLVLPRVVGLFGYSKLLSSPIPCVYGLIVASLISSIIEMAICEEPLPLLPFWF
jgi:hypothetical protein